MLHRESVSKHSIYISKEYTVEHINAFSIVQTVITNATSNSIVWYSTVKTNVFALLRIIACSIHAQ